MLTLLKKKKKEKLPTRQRGNSCLNCETVLDGNENFCPECGQRNNTNQLNFKLIIDEFVGNLITYDSRVWNTAIPLILKPGKIAYEFVSGKRKQFVNPFRTYFTISLLFFLIYGILGKISELSGDSEKFKPSFVTDMNDGIKDGLSVKQKDSIANAAILQAQNNVPIKIDSTIATNNINIEDGVISMDSITNAGIDKNSFGKKIKAFYYYYDKNKEHPVSQALDSLGYKNSFWNRFYYGKTKDVYNMFEDKAEGINQAIFSNFSLAIFLFLPVFALFLKLIYLRRKYTYMEHLVFVFYTQSVFFLLMLLFILISFFMTSGSESFILIFLLLFAVYLFLAMKNFYKQSWIKTILKYLLSNFAFMMIALFGLIVLVFVSFLFY